LNDQRLQPPVYSCSVQYTGCPIALNPQVLSVVDINNTRVITHHCRTIRHSTDLTDDSCYIDVQGRNQNFVNGGTEGGLGDGSPPTGSKGRATAGKPDIKVENKHKK